MNGEEINLQSEHKECRPENNHYRMKSAEHVPLFLILLFFHEVKQKKKHLHILQNTQIMK